MKLSINGFSQDKLIEYELDATDTIIIQHIMLCCNSNMQKFIGVKNEVYVWLTEEKIIDDLPFLRLQKRGMYDRLSNLLKKGIIKKIIKCDKGFTAKKTFYSISNKVIEMHYKKIDVPFADLEDIQGNEQTTNITLFKPKFNEKYDFETLFNLFWKKYPRKVGKGNCEKWFNTHRPNKKLVDKMIISLEEQKMSEQWTREKGQFIPHPYTWLNGKRWEDEENQIQDKFKPHTKSDKEYEKGAF